MIESIIRERKIKWCDAEFFQPHMIEVNGFLEFEVMAPVEMQSSEGNPMSYIPVHVYEDNQHIGTVKLGSRTYKGITSHPVYFQPTEYGRSRNVL